MLKLDDAEARAAWAALVDHLARLDADVRVAPLAPTRGDAGRAAIAAAVARLDPARPRGAAEALAAAYEGLVAHGVHPTHPRYFGPFTPAPATMGVLADALVSAVNAQLATVGHAPFAVACERWLLAAFAARFGWDASASEGTFTSGGAEANATALACALARAFPAVREGGLRALPGAPRLYASRDVHGSIAKAARAAGLGDGAVRLVATDAEHRARPDALARASGEDRAAGHLPFLVVATLGTTSTGAVDPLAEMARVAARAGCWLHVDAAWGGLAAFTPALAHLARGAELADSITFDPHKALAAPLGVGTLLVRRAGALRETFAVRAGYVPSGGDDPYATSLSWSRRFLGLKVLLPLAVAGWDGAAAALAQMAAVGAHLRRRVVEVGFRLRNATELPLVCFDAGAGRALEPLARAAIAEGAGWLSVTRLPDGSRALRASVNGPSTTLADADALALALARALPPAGGSAPPGERS